MSERWHKQREDPLIGTRSSPHQFRYVKIWSVSFQTDTHSDKKAFWRESKAHFRWQWKLYFIFETSALFFFSDLELSVIMKYWLKKLVKKMFPRQMYSLFATNAIYQYVTQPHHVMILQAIYSFVRDGTTFDQCVWPCITLLPPHVILNMKDEAFSLYGDKGEVHPLCTLSVRQIAFGP